MEERRKPFKLLVHEASFSEDELLVDRKWMPNVRNGSLLEIVHPAATDRRLVLRVALLGPFSSTCLVRGNVSSPAFARVS